MPLPLPTPTHIPKLLSETIQLISAWPSEVSFPSSTLSCTSHRIYMCQFWAAILADPQEPHITEGLDLEKFRSIRPLIGLFADKNEQRLIMFKKGSRTKYNPAEAEMKLMPVEYKVDNPITVVDTNEFRNLLIVRHMFPFNFYVKGLEFDDIVFLLPEFPHLEIIKEEKDKDVIVVIF